jgi:glycosyltransferase involved in cell wall biosynthesis
MSGPEILAPPASSTPGVKHVAFVSGTYRPEADGVSHYTERLREALAARGVSSMVLTTHEAARASKDPNVTGVVGGWGPRDLPALVRAVRSAERDWGADLLHVQHAGGTYGFRRAVFFLPPLLRAAGVRLPLVTTAHEYAWWEWEPRLIPSALLEAAKVWGQSRALWDREDGFLLTGSDAIVATNAPIADAITGRLPSYEPRLHCIPLGANVDVAPVERDEARRAVRSRFGWPEGAEVVAFFGFLHPVKGLETLFEAFAKVVTERRNARLLLVGGVESLALPGEEAERYWGKLHALARELRLEGSVALTGYLPDDEASRLLSGADLGVLPFNHGATLKSGSLLALFAHGLPIVATRPEGPEPDLAGDLVRLVERKHDPGLADALLTLLSDGGERARLVEAGRDYVRGRTWPSIAERHLEVYRSVLGGQRPRERAEPLVPRIGALI